METRYSGMQKPSTKVMFPQLVSFDVHWVTDWQLLIFNKVGKSCAQSVKTWLDQVGYSTIIADKAVSGISSVKVEYIYLFYIILCPTYWINRCRFEAKQDNNNMHFQLAQEIDRMRKRIKKTWVFFSAFEDSESKHKRTQIREWRQNGERN